MATYIQKVDASDLSLSGGTATRDLTTGTGTDTNFTANPANGGGTETHFFVTIAGVPNSDAWESGGTQTVEVEVDSGDGDIDCDVRIGRCDSSGTILQVGSFVGVQDMSATRSYSPVAPTWTGGEEACGNRYFAELLFTNNAAHGNHSVDVGVGTTANEVVTDITETAGTCAPFPLATAFRRRRVDPEELFSPLTAILIPIAPAFRVETLRVRRRIDPPGLQPGTG